MKTAKKILSEVKKEKVQSLIPGIEILRTKQQIFEEAAKRYARQCCEDVLNRAAENAERVIGHREFDSIIETSIIDTEIILP